VQLGWPGPEKGRLGGLEASYNLPNLSLVGATTRWIRWRRFPNAASFARGSAMEGCTCLVSEATDNSFATIAQSRACLDGSVPLPVHAFPRT
jgi:hypothetical protein